MRQNIAKIVQNVKHYAHATSVDNDAKCAAIQCLATCCSKMPKSSDAQAHELFLISWDGLRQHATALSVENVEKIHVQVRTLIR